jgi:hypothetical protein
MPGMSVLGGAAAGFSYEGALRDALARQARGLRQQLGGTAGPPAQQTQSQRSERAVAQQQRQQG